MSWECFDCLKDIICTQWALVALVILLFAVYVTPKVLVFVLSSFLSKFIPCILTVQRFGFIWARGVTITFINGECMYVDSIYLSSSLWNPKAKTLLSAWITGVEFHATDTGLYAIIKVMQRKGDGIRTHLNKGFMSWKIRLISFISIDISSIQIVVLSTKFLDDALYSNYKKAEDGALNNTNSNSSVCHYCLIHINDLSDVYPPIQFNRQTSLRLNKTSKLALTLRMKKLTMLFHISMRQAHVNLHVSHICGKLLCIPVFMETWLSNDLFVKNWNVIFENAYILGHLRLQLSTNISLECRNFSNATLSSLNGWFVKSVDLKLCGLRIAILEELMDLLSWKLYINQTCILTTQTSSFESTCSHCHQFTIKHQEDTLQMLKHSSFSFKNNKSCYLKQTSGNIISDNSLKSNFQCVQQCLNSIKLCISFLPVQLFNFNHNHHFEQIQPQLSSSSSSSSLPSSFVPEMGFCFEIIRYSFERSLQFYFTSSHLSMEFNMPNSIKSSENDETLQTTSDFYTSLHSLSLPISRMIPSNLLSDNVDSKILFSHFILLNFRFCLNDLRLLNGWNSQAQHCLLDARIYLIEATEQLESSICNIYLNILHSSIFYIHDHIIEMNFYNKLSSICYLIGIWCKTLYDNSNCINNQSIMPITNIGLFNCPKKNMNSKQFNLMTQESLSRRKFFRFIEYLGLNTRQLNVRIYFGNVGGSRTSVRNNNIITSSTSITRHNVEEFGASDSTVSDDNSGGGVIITHCKSVNCTDDFNTEQQYPDHIQIGMMEKLKSRKIPQILFVLIPDLKSPGLQLGFTNSLVNLQFDFHELNLKKSFDLLNLTDLNLKLSNFHVCLLDKIHGSIFDESHTSQAPSLSLPHSYSLYSIRCNQSNAIYSLIHELPTLNNHHWDDLFYVHGIDIWNHKYQISLKFTTLQIEWPSFKINELMNYIHWDYSNKNVYQCYNNHVNKLSINRSSSIQCYFTENYLNNPIQFDGFLENINIFFINSNNSFIMLRIDSQRFIAQFRSINPIYQPLKLDSLSQITVTGAKLVYSYIKKLDNGVDTVSCCSSTSSASFSSNSSPCPYAIVSSCDIKNDLVLSLTEIRVDVKLPDQSIEISPNNQSCEFIWSLGFHLCCYNLLRSWKQFYGKLFKQSSTVSLNNSSNTCDPFLVPTINNTTINGTIELNSSNGWHLSIKPIQSYFQFYFKLLTNKHFIMVRVKNTSFQYTPKTITNTDNKISNSNDRKNREVLLTNSTNMDDDNNKNNIGCIVSSRLKVNCEHAVIMCEDQTIAVFQNLKIRQRPKNIQHRTEHLKMGLLTRANPSWEFYMDLLYVTFPYRYIFRDVYQEASCVRKFLLKLHSNNITYFHVNDHTFDQSKKSSLPNENVTLSNPTSPTSIQSSPSTFGVYSSSTARIDYIQSSTSYIKQDRIIHIKKFVIEIKDDPFECKLNDIHTILLDEFAVHEKRVNTLREQIDRAIHSGIRFTDEERQACFTRIEMQRAKDYRNRLHRFYCDYAFSDELFTFTMDNLKIKALADESITHGEQVIAQMKIMDSDSPWPNLTEQDFSTLWCRIITMNVERWRLQLRDYPKPCLNITDLFLWGKLVIAEQMADNKGQHKVVIEPGYPWPNYTLIRFSSPTKFYYDLNADLKSFHIYYGANWEPTVSWFNQRLDDIKPLIKDKSYPPLGWWDKIRLLYHGHLLFAVDTMHWSYSTSLSPYNATEFFTWQWNRTVVHWENGVIRIDGDLDIVYQTASKYDGICRLFHIPHLEMTVKLDWLSLRDPNDHHSVKYCYMDYLSPREQTQHDSFKYFRANRLAMDINFTVKPPPTGSSTMDQRPWCSFYTSVLKFADKLRNCLSQIPRPIRRGSLYQYKPPRKPHFGRLLQSLEFSINIPQLELIFWVSYAKRTGVHVNTGPIQIIGKLKCKIENEIKLNRLIGKFNTSSASSSSTTVIVPDVESTPLETTSTTNVNEQTTILHPYVMIPPRLSIQRNGLSRRPIVNWCVLNLYASIHDIAIHLRHRDNLPGPLIQMLLQCMNTYQNCINDISNNLQLNHHNFSIHDIEQLDTEEMNNDIEAFILVPLLRYQQLCPTVLPSNTTVRVHIPGPRPTAVTSVTTSTTNTNTNENSNICNNNSGNTNLSPSSIKCHPIESIKNNTSINSTSTITENISADVTSTSQVVDEKTLPFSNCNNNNRTTFNNINHIQTPRYNYTATLCSSNSQLTHEDLTPVHHLEIHEFKMRWTEQHRNLVYILMDSYRHAQSLKKNLSARALHGFRLHPGGNGSGHTTTMTSGGGVSGAVGSSGIGKLGVCSSSSSGGGDTALSRNARSAIQLTNNVNNNGCILLNSTDKRPLSTVIQPSDSCNLSKLTKSNYNDNCLLMKMPTTDEMLPDNINMPSNAVTMVTATTTTTNNNNNSEMKEDNYDDVYLSTNLSPSSESNKSKLTFSKQIPMLAQLLEEVDTARFYAYCEEEPKQTDVVSQLQGLHICASSLVAERNWHLELINPQLMLKTNHLAGYVLVSAARAKLDALTHPPIWKDSQLLNKSSLVGHLECMQYYATVGQVLPETPDQWLSTADVSDWTHHNLNADEDALSGRPEVVGCGRSVGGVVTACVGFPKTPSNNNNISNIKNPLTRTSTLTFGTKLMSNDMTLRNNVTLTSTMVTTTPTTTTVTSSTSELHSNYIRPIQLQRMISRCSCEVFYIHYEPADPANLPLPHLIPPLSLDETEVVRNPEGADTVTLLHHTLNVSTNSLQYHMIVEIVNDLLLYVEPQRKAKLERNRLTFGLMSESQVRLAISRDQETLRRLIFEQRQLERYLWSYVRQTMQELGLDANNTLINHSYPSAFYHSPTTDSSNNVTSRTSDLTLKLVNCIQSARKLETQINQLKSHIIDLNGILSQRLGHYQQLQIQIQRRHIRKAMSFKRYHPMNKSSASSSLLSFNNEILSSITNSNNVSLIQKSSNDDCNRIIQTNNNESETYIQNRINLHNASSTDHLTHPTAKTMSNNNTGQNHLITENIISESSNKSLSSSSFMDGGDSKPAEIVRRSEVCFEHARWRMTENDGQIGLADVELRGFIYTKTHRQDDSGSHRLELGWIRVCSLAPNSFYREVLAPDVSGGRYAGGPILRIACSDLAPVGGISVKEAMEISVAPIVLQMSKQFYRIMMPFFFPEKSEDTITNNTVTATPVHTATIANPTGDHVGIVSGTSTDAFHYLDSNLSTNADNPQNILLPSKSWLRRYVLRKLPHRFKNQSESVPSTSSLLPEPLNFIHNSRQSDILENISSDLSMPIVVSTPATTVTFTSSLSPSSVCIPSNNLTIEAAISGRNYCSVNDDWNALNNNATRSGTEITVASSPSLTSSSVTTSKLLQMMNMRTKLPITDYLRSQNELVFPNLFHTNEYDVKSSSSSLSPNHKSNECFAIPVTYSNYNDTTTDNFFMVMQQPTSIYLQQLLPVNNICTYCESIHSTSNNHHLHSLNMSLYNPISYGSLPMDQITSINQIAMHHSKHNINNTNIPLNPVDVMQERARQNKVFLYIKIPGFPIRLSYKGEKQKNITDVTRFELFIPTLEYHNCVWTWLDFVMEVKTRIRKQLVREVIKKKLTPRRRLPLLRISGTNSSKNDNNSSIAANSSTDSKPHELTTSNILLSSVKRLSSLTPSTVTGGRADSTMHSPDVDDDDDDLVNPTTVAAQEEKAQRDLEMILGRHAQIQPNKAGKRKRFKSKQF
ncbi:unnamed protein product [Schistosoma rodhaini]|uniref:FMP27/BLTP2/Hobbit GFWDK motif-containing RBG unit domain-containing protein n=3 Tax=Schistosoma rodhaini TaxID=6188 RepID=A0AA85GDA6_9TREM|nr:unnamed protein product [Schistosoma rodhaini]